MLISSFVLSIVFLKFFFTSLWFFLAYSNNGIVIILLDLAIWVLSILNDTVWFSPVW